MFWLLAILTVLVALLIAIVVLPVRFRLRGQAGEETRVRLDISTFGGIVPAVPVFDTAKKQKGPPKKRKPAGAAESRKSTSKLPYRGLFRLVIELLGQFRFVWIRGEAEFGFDDPADTGTVYGILAPIIYTGRHAADLDLDIRPDFEKSGISGRLDTAVEVIPIRLLPPILRFGWQTFGPR